MYRFKVTIDHTKVQSVNGSTSFIDVSGKVWTASGAAQLSTITYKFAPASGYFDGASGTSISTPDSADYAMGTGDYTIDLWFKTTTSGGNIFYQGDNSGTASTLAHNFGLSSGRLWWSPDYDNYPSNHILQSIGSVNDDAWHHVACVRYGDVFTLYLDGVSQATTTITGYSAVDSAYPFYICKSNSYTGYIDEFRISKGVARWTSGPFTVPTDKYSTD
jgi:hypothetical protein